MKRNIKNDYGSKYVIFTERLEICWIEDIDCSIIYKGVMDEDKTNNCVDNLEWCTHKYNSNYGTRPKRIGEFHAKRKGKQ